MSVRFLPRLLLLVALLLGTGCSDPGLARVRVTLVGLHDSEARNIGADTVELEVFFRRPRVVSDSDVFVLHNGAQWNPITEERRVLWWDGRADRFTFDVLLPPGMYQGLRGEARIARRCGESVQFQTLAVGSSDESLVFSAGGEREVQLVLMPRAESCR